MKHIKSVTKFAPARASFIGWLVDLVTFSFLSSDRKDSPAPGNPYEDTDLGGLSS